MRKHEALQRRRPRQARAQATVASILEAAAQVLERAGADGLTTNRVAERAGVSIGTLYQYFPDKDAILLAVARRELAKTDAPSVSPQRALLEALVRALEALLGGGAAQRVRASRTAGRNSDRTLTVSRIKEFVFGGFAVPAIRPMLARAVSRNARA